MNEFFVLAFVVMPILVVALGYIVMRLHEREADRLGLQETGPGGVTRPPARTSCAAIRERWRR